MHPNSDLKARKKHQSSILPLALKQPFNATTSTATSTARKYLPILLLLFLLHFVLTGNIIPAPILSFISFISSPITFMFTTKNAPSSITVFTDPKYLGGKYQNGLTTNKKIIPEKNKYIFPLIQEAPILKEIGLDKLFTVVTDNSNKKVYQYSPDYFDDIASTDDPDNSAEKNPDLQGLKTYSDTIKHFKDNGHRIYTGNEKPEIVLVTAINYEDFDPSYLVKIIQNRVDYAHFNHFAVYSRWVQEFTPIFQEYKNDPNGWSKIFILREAMYAFPTAKWFWFIDENSLIMRDDININDYLLKPNALAPIILRNQPLLPPDGAIKTYSNTLPENVSLILTQNVKGLNTDNFLIKNDLTGRAILELWMDPLFRKYPSFRKDESSALAHLLQWHPVVLSKTAIIPPRAIAAVAPEKSKGLKTNEFVYQDGDFVVSLNDCKAFKNCEDLLRPYWDKTQETWSKEYKNQQKLKKEENAKQKLNKIEKVDALINKDKTNKKKVNQV